MKRTHYDSVVVGAGPNGLAAAIAMQQQGLSVLLVEASETIGGGLRTKELTLPGFFHDVCSAIHPLAAGSPFFKALPLAQHGLEYILPPIHAAHPFDGGSAAVLKQSIEETSRSLGADKDAYTKLISSVVRDWPGLSKAVLGPFKIPNNPIELAAFGVKALQPATMLAGRLSTIEGRGLLAGMSAHSILPLTKISTSAIGLVLMAVGHIGGWPIPKGGSHSIANALASYFVSLGGEIQTSFKVDSLTQLPSSEAILFDLTPKQLLKIAGNEFSSLYKWQLNRYRYGMGVFKIDWALDGPIPFTNTDCRSAGTIHLGNTLEEIVSTEQETWNGGHPDKPFVLLAQQSLFDRTRAPEGKHTAWAYCHVPNGSVVDMTKAIESQVERFAPGFKDLILARHTMNTGEMETYNSNYIGGDINGGVIDINQLYTRPALRISPYKTSKKGIYICSSSTPPGGGVHGMCGYHAAKQAMKDVFNLEPVELI